MPKKHQEITVSVINLKISASIRMHFNKYFLKNSNLRKVAQFRSGRAFITYIASVISDFSANAAFNSDTASIRTPFVR